MPVERLQDELEEFHQSGMNDELEEISPDINTLKKNKSLKFLLTTMNKFGTKRKKEVWYYRG